MIGDLFNLYQAVHAAVELWLMARAWDMITTLLRGLWNIGSSPWLWFGALLYIHRSNQRTIRNVTRLNRLLQREITKTALQVKRRQTKGTAVAEPAKSKPVNVRKRKSLAERKREQNGAK